MFGNGRKGEVEARPLAELRLGPDAPPVPVDDSLANREADSRAGDISVSVESLEHSEDSLRISLIKSYTVVPDRKSPLVAISLGVKFNARAALRPEFQCVPNDILEQLPQL